MRLCRQILTLVTIFWSSGLFAAVTATQTRNSVWSFGFNGAQHNLKSSDGTTLLGTSAIVQLGRGYIDDNWYMNASLDIISGPYQSPQENFEKLDYYGTGFSTVVGYSAETANIRTTAGSYGFALGLNYADIVGRVVTREASQGKHENIDDVVMRVTNFAVIPSLFFCWLEEARPRGNDPSLLMTRIEGYFLTIGMAMPIRSSYKVKYTRYNGDESIPDSSGGRLRGYTLMAYFTILFGI